MRRVSVVGSPGAGKSTLAAGLAAALRQPHVELDAIFHQPAWGELPTDEFRDRVTAATSSDGWVVDGNYSAVRDIVWRRADTVVWIDLPRGVVMRRLIWRTVVRVVLRRELWNGNREPWRNLVSLNPDKSVVAWGWTHYAATRDRYEAAMRDPNCAHLRFVRVRSDDEIRALLDAARSGPSQPEESGAQ